jgi:transposase
MYQISHPSKQDQRAVIQFLGAEGCQPAKIHQRMQTVYGNACVSKTTVNDWCRQFRQGRQSTADLARPGASRVATTPANIAAVETLIRGETPMSIKAIAADLNISVGTVHSIIQNLGYILRLYWNCTIHCGLLVQSSNLRCGFFFLMAIRTASVVSVRELWEALHYRVPACAERER